eukprot:PhM_4_TR1895/c0_g2_i1/m.38047
MLHPPFLVTTVGVVVVFMLLTSDTTAIECDRSAFAGKKDKGTCHHHTLSLQVNKLYLDVGIMDADHVPDLLDSTSLGDANSFWLTVSPALREPLQVTTSNGIPAEGSPRWPPKVACTTNSGVGETKQTQRELLSQT